MAVLNSDSKDSVPVKGVKSNKDNRQSILIRLSPDIHNQLKYFSSKHDISLNAYVTDLIIKGIARENSDYPLPTLEQARLNQLIERMDSLESTQKNWYRSIQISLNSLIGLTRGGNYLTDEVLGDDE